MNKGMRSIHLAHSYVWLFPYTELVICLALCLTPLCSRWVAALNRGAASIARSRLVLKKYSEYLCSALDLGGFPVWKTTLRFAGGGGFVGYILHMGALVMTP